MLVLHGICTGETHRPWKKIDQDTGEVRQGNIDRWAIFDGRQTFDCQLSDDFGAAPKLGEVVTVSVVAVSEYQRRQQLTLGGPVDADVVKAFTPELAKMLMATGLAQADNHPAPARAQS
jgi:hypothetical protein